MIRQCDPAQPEHQRGGNGQRHAIADHNIVLQAEHRQAALAQPLRLQANAAAHFGREAAENEAVGILTEARRGRIFRRRDGDVVAHHMLRHEIAHADHGADEVRHLVVEPPGLVAILVGDDRALDIDHADRRNNQDRAPDRRSARCRERDRGNEHAEMQHCLNEQHHAEKPVIHLAAQQRGKITIDRIEQRHEDEEEADRDERRPALAGAVHQPQRHELVGEIGEQENDPQAVDRQLAGRR